MNIVDSAWYKALPVLLQNAIVTFKGIVFYYIRRSSYFYKLRDILIRNESLSATEIEQMQLTRLKQHLIYCDKHVPYYHKLFKEYGLNPQTVSSIKDIDCLPIITKDIVRNNYDTLRAQHTGKWFKTSGFTSGTTSIPLYLDMDRDLIASEHAFAWRQYRWAGIPERRRMAIIREEIIVPAHQKKPPYWRYDAFTQNLYLSAFHMSASTIQDYSTKLFRFNPHVLFTYPSNAYSLALHAKNAGISLKFPALKAIITSSEVLYSFQKSLIEEIFGVKVFDWYGSFERVIFIGTCEQGSLHIFPDYGITELIPVPGETNLFELVGTGFINKAMPLIRYKSNDMVSLSNTPCSCGRNFPVVKSIVGRSSDAIITKDGRTVSDISSILFKNVEHVTSCQIIQETIGSIIILLVTGAAYSKNNEAQFLANLHNMLGDTVEIELKYVDRIPTSKNGKYCMIISKVKIGQQT